MYWKSVRIHIKIELQEIEKRLRIDLTCSNYDSRRGVRMFESGFGQA